MGILNYQNPTQSGEKHFLESFVGSWEHHPRHSERPVIFDVGANVGSYANLVRAIFPAAEIHAFEPHPRTAQRLGRRLGQHITVIDKAVGAAPGTLDLFDYEDADGSSHASPYRDVFVEIHGKTPTPPLSVPVIRIDDYIERNGISHVLLLKIDTEGHELEVLKGASSSLDGGVIECIQFEFNEMNVISRAFLRDFTDTLSGFVLFRLLPRGMVRLRGTPLEEIFAYQNIIAIKRHSPFLDRFL